MSLPNEKEYGPTLAALVQSKHPFRQWKTWEIKNTQLTMTGYSRSNDKTFFHIPELRCCLDAALCEGRQPERVFITHTHNDHIADIEFLAGRSQGVDMYVPNQALPYVEAYLKARRELNHMAPFNPELAGALRLHGVNPGDTIEWKQGKRDQYAVEIFACQHKIPCVGYGFSALRSRLKPEFEIQKNDMKPAEFGRFMGQQRKAGVEVNEQYHAPLFAFLGDTHASVFAQNDALFRYPVIVTECTFLDDSEQERADKNGHTTWRELKPVICAHPEITFVLTHFSLRHSDAEVVQFFQNEANEARQAGEPTLDNVVIWAHNDSLLPGQHQSSTS